MDKSNERGSSLIEVIMAMIIMAILITGLNTCLVALINTNVYSKEISNATANGNALLEKMRLASYGTIVTGSDIVKSKYVRSWTVTDDGVKKKVSLTVLWPIATNKHTVELSTLIAKP